MVTVIHTTKKLTKALKVRSLDIVNIVVTYHIREKHMMHNLQVVLYTEVTAFILYLVAVNTTCISNSADKSLQQGHILGLLNVVLILSATNNNFEKLLFT